SKERDRITLARVAASGGQWFRGSADQTGVGGKVYSAFLFSSILIPGIMKPQDVQRLIKLDMQPLDRGIAKLNLKPRTWRARGVRLKAHLIARWGTWDARLSAWRHALELQGITNRDADNWGTVLAMADMACQERIATPEEMEPLARKVAFQVASESPDTANDAEAMLLYLMGQQFDVYRRGQRFTVAQWVAAGAALPGADKGLVSEAYVDAEDYRKMVNRHLGNAGMRVYVEGSEPSLFIANKPIQGLKDLFHGSDWAGGVWKQSAARVPGAVAVDQPRTLNRIQTRGYIIPLKAIPGMMSFPSERVAQQPDVRPSDEIEDFR
ncbi:MAG: hypothetical protein ACKVKF_22675, partial [Rhodobacterales bacterium]